MQVPIVRFVLALLLAVSVCLTALANQSLVTMNVVNGEVRDVLTALAEIGHVNLVVDDSVTGGITIQFNNVLWETALELVAQTKGLAYHHVNNVLIVGNPEQIGRSFGNVHLFKLKYINPDALHDTALSILFGETKGEKSWNQLRPMISAIWLLPKRTAILQEKISRRRVKSPQC